MTRTAPAGWGRWGDEDQRGAANLVDTAAVARGLSAVSEYRSISLAAPLDRRSPAAANRAPLRHWFVRTGADYETGARRETDGMGFADDYIEICAHGSTHLDALCHVWSDGQMYNGFSRNLVSSGGARALGIERVGAIATRGVLLDAVAHGGGELRRPVEPPDLDRLLDRAGVSPEPGDALLVRTGWRRRVPMGQPEADAVAGVSRNCAAWIAERDVVLVGADNPAVEVVGTSGPASPPLHISLLRDRGIYLLELLDLEELSATGRSEFLLVVNPVPVRGASGGLCAPVAIV